MSCSDPNPQIVSAEVHAKLEARRAAYYAVLRVERAVADVESYARSLASRAYYATHFPAPGVILLPRSELPSLSPEAAEMAHGVVEIFLRTGPRRGVEAWVCLDCHAVGFPSGPEEWMRARTNPHTCVQEP